MCWAFFTSDNFDKKEKNPYTDICKDYFTYALAPRKYTHDLLKARMDVVEKLEAKIASPSATDKDYALLTSLLSLDTSSDQLVQTIQLAQVQAMPGVAPASEIPHIVEMKAVDEMKPSVEIKKSKQNKKSKNAKKVKKNKQ